MEDQSAESTNKKTNLLDHNSIKHMLDESISNGSHIIQRKLGNLPEKAPAFKRPAYTPAQDEASAPKDKAWFDKKTEEELEDLEDDKDLDGDRFLEDYRKKRLMELREAAKVRSFAECGQHQPATLFVRHQQQQQASVAAAMGEAL